MKIVESAKDNNGVELRMGTIARHGPSGHGGIIVGVTQWWGGGEITVELMSRTHPHIITGAPDRFVAVTGSFDEPTIVSEGAIQRMRREHRAIWKDRQAKQTNVPL